MTCQTEKKPSNAQSAIKAQEELIAIKANAVVIPDDHKAVDTEKFLSAPLSVKEKFATAHIDEARQYCVKNAHEGIKPAVFIDENSMSAAIIIDRTTPESPTWQSHRATIALKKLPEYTELLRNANATHSQKSFLDFIHDHAANITFFEPDTASDNPLATDKIDFNDGFMRCKSITVDTSKNATQSLNHHSASMTAAEQLAVKSNNKSLPAVFVFTCQPFDGLEKVSITAMLSPVIGEKEVSLKYRLIALHIVEKAIADDFKEKLQYAFANIADVYIGTI